MSAMHAPSPEDVRWADRVSQGIHGGGDHLTGHLTQHLQAHARTFGWPEAAVKHLHVEHEAGAFHPRFREEGREIVESYEYGGFDRRPAPAMRMWAAQSHEHASDAHNSILGTVMEWALF